ncbi:MAG: DUF2799 domain-containing protein [Marinicaulis sp.]|nr:DUF2799 domain-containing protein [Marinicaulis sp.]
MAVRNTSIVSLSLCSVLLASGCASMSKEACLHADWRAIGYEDGADGQPISAASSKRTACAKKAGVTIDMAQYVMGREEGLTLYCRPSRGYTLGAGGGYYHGVCTGSSEADFLAAYEAGRRLYAMERAITTMSAEIRQAQYDLNDVEYSLVRTETALIDTNVPGVSRVNLLIELKQLLAEKHDLDETLAKLTYDQARTKGNLRDYREHMALNGPLPRPATTAVQVNY